MKPLYPLLLAPLLAACTQNSGATAKHNTPFFPPESRTTTIDRFNAVQICNGAKDDATLYSVHFTDGSLNPLGQQKLRDILCNHAPGDTVVLYVDAADHTSLHHRRQAIDRFLASDHLFHGAIDVRQGPNPRMAYPAAPGLAALARSEKAKPTASSTNNRGYIPTPINSSDSSMSR